MRFSSSVRERARRWLEGPGAQALSNAPSPDSLGALLLGGVRAGYLTPAVCKAITSDPALAAHFVISGTTFSLLSDSSESERTAALSRLFLSLEARGLTQKRRNEALDITVSGRRLAQAERALFRTLGLHTTAVRLFAQTPDGRFFFQRRSALKSIGPGLWDSLAAGMVSAGETPLESMCREIHEEAGLLLAPAALTAVPALSFESTVTVPAGFTTGFMREKTAVFSALLPEDTILRNLDGEADAFALLSAEDALELIENARFMPEAACVITLYLCAAR